MPLHLSHSAPRARRRRLVVATVALALAGSTLLAGPAQAAPTGGRAVALGDSFASGEGLAPYRAGTDTATNSCHRSRLAYPELLDEGRHPAVKRVRSVACSGALTGDVIADLRPGDDVPAQVDALSRRTRTVTLTVGGNDVGFATVLGACTYTPVAALQEVVPGRPGCREELDPAVTLATAGLAGKAPTGPGRVSLAQVLVQVHRAAPRAKVYVTGYPRLFGLTGFDAYGCRVGSVGEAPLYVSSADVRWVRAKSDGLNAALRTGVAQARSLGVPATYVDVAEAFTSHNVCGSGTPWLNGVLLAPTSPPSLDRATFHPDVKGQQAYAQAVAAAVRARPRT